MRIAAAHHFASISSPSLAEPPKRAPRLGQAHLRSLALATILAASPICARADIAVSSNDGHTKLDNGVLVAAHPSFADTLAVIDLSASPPHIKTIIDVPGSVVGPPTAVAVAPDESWAVVTSATKPDASSPTGNGPDDRVSVVDLRSSPPKIVQSLTAGAGASTVRISPDGSFALVANRAEGTVSVFTIAEGRLTPAGKVDLGNPKAGPSGIGFTRDGSAALVSRDGDNMITVLHVEHAPGAAPKITIDPRPITTGVHPYTLDVNAAGTLAAVANMGRGDGDIDTVSLIDLTQPPFRTVETLAVGRSPEGVKFSPDGGFLAVAAQEGTAKAPNSPFFSDFGKLMMFAVRDPRMRIAGPWLREVAETPIGRWSQGVAFSRDGTTCWFSRWENGALPCSGGRTMACLRRRRCRRKQGRRRSVRRGPEVRLRSERNGPGERRYGRGLAAGWA